jgi:Zn-dependent protease
MIPLPPLDGHHLLAYIAPPKVEEILERIGPFGILIAVFFIARPLFRLLAPVFDGVLALSGLPLMV